MKNFKSSYCIAEDLMIDDHIKVAGLPYRIQSVDHLSDDSMEIHVYSTEGLRRRYGILRFANEALMKIWNQK